MKGITAYGAYLPYYRLKRETILKAMGWFNPAIAGLAKGEKAVANYDEDSLTMAVAAGRECLAEADQNWITSLYLASTTLSHRERGSAAIAGTALNLPPSTATAEFSGSIKSGTTALITALNTPGSDITMVCAADCRLGKAGGTLEQLFGDGAAAIVVGSEKIIALPLGVYSLSYDFADLRRMESDKYTRSWEERWIRQAGYSKMVPEAVQGVLEKCNLRIKDLAKVVIPPISARDHKVMVKVLGLEAGQVQGHLIETVGNTGSAHPFLALIGALEEAKPGDKILIASYGSGSDAILFEVTDEITHIQKGNRLGKHLDYKRELEEYTKYLSFKGMLDKEIGIRGEEVAATSLSLAWREQNAILRLVGAKCIACGTPQFPRESVCINPQCRTTDKMEDYPFSDKTGTLFTYTADHLTFTEDPPASYGIVDFSGGGRYWFDLTDCHPDDLEVGIPLKMTFRRRYLDENRSIAGYFWKAMPIKG